MNRSTRLASLAACTLLFSGCSETTAPTAVSSGTDGAFVSRADLTCTVLEASGTNPLGIVPAGFEGAGNFGGLPGPFTISIMGESVTGTLRSYLTSRVTPVGANAQGATHITLRHVFTSEAGSFRTDDRAVCAPDPNGIATCRLMDQMTPVEGTGAFEDVAGKLHNQGFLDFATYTLTFHLKGTICGAGV